MLLSFLFFLLLCQKIAFVNSTLLIINMRRHHPNLRIEYFRSWMELGQLWQFKHEKWGQNTVKLSVLLLVLLKG